MTSKSIPASDVARVENVLVPLDGSEFSLRAMPTARALAERFEAALHTISVVTAGENVDRLAGLASAVLDVPGGDGRACVVRGEDVTDEILRRGEELGGCVVCLSTHGRGRLSGAVVGSVARELVQRSDRPLVALGPVGDLPDWSRSPRWPPPLSVPRIVACVDGSDASEQVLPAASAWAQALGMSLTIVTVIEDGPPPLRPERQKSAYGGTRDAKSYVDALADRLSQNASTVNGHVVRDPLGPASGIRTYLAEEPAGMVALTSHARTGVGRALFGATAAGIVQVSPCPCLVVPLDR